MTSLARRLDGSNCSNSLDLGLVSRHSHGSITAPYPRPAAGRHTDGDGNASVLPGGGDQALSGVRLLAGPRRGGLVPLRRLRGAAYTQEEAGSAPAGTVPTAHEGNQAGVLRGTTDQGLDRQPRVGGIQGLHEAGAAGGAVPPLPAAVPASAAAASAVDSWCWPKKILSWTTERWTALALLRR